MRVAVQEIGRAIQRIDDPAAGRVFAGHGGRFFANPAIAWAGGHQFFVDDLFCGDIGPADKITRTFHRNLEVLNLAEVLDQTAASFARGFDHDV